MQQELQAIADQVAQFLKLSSRPIVEVKPVKRGKARPKTGRITIPEWVMSKPEAYRRYYIAHEVCHFFTGLKHSAAFKDIENEVLKELWGVGILRRYPRPPHKHLAQAHRVYPVSLIDLESGKVLWSCEWPCEN
jgi:hypothetical protein